MGTQKSNLTCLWMPCLTDEPPVHSWPGKNKESLRADHRHSFTKSSPKCKAWPIFEGRYIHLGLNKVVLKVRVQRSLIRSPKVFPHDLVPILARLTIVAMHHMNVLPTPASTSALWGRGRQFYNYFWPKEDEVLSRWGTRQHTAAQMGNAQTAGPFDPDV